MRLLKFFNAKTKRYERPNQNWVCGRTCAGAACLEGPDRRGNCQATFECRPVKKGDRWHCTRPASLGGPCDDGPTPMGACQHAVPKCSPIRSLRSWRVMLVWLGVAATLAAVVLILTRSNTQQIFTAGPLSVQHSVFTARCSECHPGATPDAPALQWFRAGGASPHVISDMCLRCHALGENALTAHSLPPSALPQARVRKVAQAGTGPTAEKSLVLAAFAVNGERTKIPANLECSVCHEEHHGRDHRLTEVSEVVCQTCHAVQFQSFSHGHPAFQNYPFRRRSRIIFNHISHFENHFKDPASAGTGAWNCASCHIQDAQGRKMRVASFDKSCAPCHGNQVRGIGRADSPSIAFLKIPGIDVLTFEDKEVSIGDWPEFAEGKLTPFMKLLLSNNSTNAALVERIGDKDLLDLSKEKDPVVQDAAALAWTVKELFSDLATQGQSAIEARLRARMGDQLSQAQLRSLAAAVSPAAIQNAVSQWFPHLASDVAAHRAGKAPVKLEKKAADPKSESNAAKPEDLVVHGGWYSSSTDYTVYYRPSGHADEFLHEWLDASAGTTAGTNIFAVLADPKAPGYCGKCHSVDATPKLVVNWGDPELDPNLHEFTRFSHASHFSLLTESGCLKCHNLNKDSGEKYNAAFAPGQRDPHRFQPNFEPMQIGLCASCHTKELVGESCLTCHNYHVGKFLATVLQPPQPPVPAAKVEKASK